VSKVSTYVKRNGSRPVELRVIWPELARAPQQPERGRHASGLHAVPFEDLTL